MRADILLRKDQVNTKEDNKDVQVLKEEIWTRRTIVEVTILKRNQTKENKLNLLEKICRNNTREKIAYIEGRTYIPNNKKLKEKILWESQPLVDVRYPKQ